MTQGTSPQQSPPVVDQQQGGQGGPVLPVWVAIVLVVLFLGVGAMCMWWLISDSDGKTVVVQGNGNSSSSAAAVAVTPGQPVVVRPMAVPVGRGVVVAAAPAAPVITTGDLAELKPTLVTLHFKDADPEQVMADLAKQASVRIATWPPEMWRQVQVKRVTIDVDNQPFWPTFRQFCQSVGIDATGNYGPSGVGDIAVTCYGPQNAGNRPAVVAGPFVVVVNSINYNKSVDLASPTNISRYFGVQLTVCVDPKIRVLAAGQQPTMTEAQDNKNHSLMAVSGGGPNWESWHNGSRYTYNVQAPLTYPRDDEGDRISTLKGSIRYLIAAATERWEVNDILTAKEADKAVKDQHYWVRSVERQNNGEQYQVKVATLKNMQAWAKAVPGMNDFEMLRKSIRVLDAQGRELYCNGGGGGGGSLGLVEYTIHYSRYAPNEKDKPGEAAKLVWDIPTEMKEISVPFEFKDLPLP